MALEGLPAGRRVLDIGGGTGAHSEVMAMAGAHPVVLDPSAAQREQARRRSGLFVVGGVAQALPFADDSFHMAYFHLSLHYGDWHTALNEACRVVSPGGRIWIWTFTRHYLETSFTGSWFPSVYTHDLRRFPDSDDIAGHLESVGVGRITHGTTVETVHRTVGSWEEAFRARFVSTLQLVDSEELEAGIGRFRATYPDDKEQIAVNLEFASIMGVVR